MNDILNESTSSVMEKPKKSACFAKLEFHALRSEIEACLEQSDGNRLSAYWTLFDSGRLTMAYRTFCNYLRSEGIRVPYRVPIIDEPEPFDLIDELHNLKELDLKRPGRDFGSDRRSMYHNLVELGIVRFGYSDFCDYYPETDV